MAAAAAAAAAERASLGTEAGSNAPALPSPAAASFDAAELGALLAHQAAFVAKGRPLASYSAEWAPAQQHHVPAPASPAATAFAAAAAVAPDAVAAAAAAAAPPPHHPDTLHGVLRVPAYTDYAYRVEGVVIEPFEVEP